MNSRNRCSMSVGTSVGASALLAAASLALSPTAWALGLGDARVESYLNQPLRARIELITQASDDLASVTARLASAADYELIGASRDAVSVPIGFSIEDIDGDAYILATSKLPVAEPVVRLIVEVNWSSGRMLREYTLFLDPPTTPEMAPPPRIDLRAAPPAAAPVPVAPAAAAPEPAPPSAVVALADGSEYGPVRSGETLWRIASDWSRGSGMDINRVMIAIQRENPDAFLRENINLLKRGAILRMPSMADVQGIPAATAFREVVSQQEAFSGPAAPATVASPATPLLAEQSAAIDLSPRVPAPAAVEPAAADAAFSADATATADEATGSEPLAEPAPELAAEIAEDVVAEAIEEAAPQDLLELVPPSADSELDSTYGFEEGAEGVGASVQALREELARKEEELVSQQQQNTYLEDRIRELEAQMASAAEEGVADADLANMEDRLREQRQAAPAERSAADRPWYARMTVWLLGLLVLVAALVGWLVSRRGRAESAPAGAAADSLRDIKSEAEDVLRVLADDTVQQPAAEDDDEADDTRVMAGERKAPARVRRADEDAELLDEDSSDPEIQLDLARAYISMGDREAARVILDEVVNNGSEGQQEEARKMLDLLT